MAYGLKSVFLWINIIGLTNFANSQKFINIAGFFEQSSDLLVSQDAPVLFQKAVDYVMWDGILPQNVTINGYKHFINTNDGFTLAEQACDALITIKVSASLGLTSKSTREFMYTVSKRTEIPYLEILSSSDYSRDSVIHMHPSPKESVNLLKLLIKNWGWEDTLLVYEYNDALVNNLDLLVMHKDDGVRVSTHQMDGDFSSAFEFLKQIGTYRVVVDCAVTQVMRFLNRALELQMLTAQFHYHFTSMDLHVLDLAHYSFGGANITWTQIVPRTSNMRENKSKELNDFESYLRTNGLYQIPKSYFTTHNMLLVDSIMAVARALKALLRLMPDFEAKSIDCDVEERWQQGFGLRNLIKKQEFHGLTGLVKFDNSGRRVDYSLMVHWLKEGGIIGLIGTYSASGDLTVYPIPPPAPVEVAEDDYMNRVLQVTTIEQEPFFKYVNREQSSEPPHYEGFCVDLMEEIANRLNMKYEFHLVRDHGFGSRQPDGSWNGMVGEVMRKEADMAVAPLTISYDREQAIDFTKPFMTFGISILYKKPQKEPPNLLSFLEPITHEVWGTIMVSLVIVSLSMYIFARFSPTEWENPFPCKPDYEFMVNHFNIANVFWFAIGSIVQQGCDIMPKSPSTRIVAIAWWFFTLIIISSYTANLAAFLTITTLSETFQTADELAQQTSVHYGCQADGNTCAFFQNSNISTFKRMWTFMNSTPGVLVKNTDEGVKKVKQGGYAYLMESPALQYHTVTDKECELQQVGQYLNSLSYGIGVKTKSPLRDKLSSAILILNEKQVLLELYNKWWKVEDQRCQLMADSQASTLTLMIANLAGVFVFLVGGLAVAMIILIVEIIVFSVKRSKIEKRSFCTILLLWLKSSLNGTFPSTSSLTKSAKSAPDNARNLKSNAENRFPEQIQPLNNGYTERIPCSDTTDTFI